MRNVQTDNALRLPIKMLRVAIIKKGKSGEAKKKRVFVITFRGSKKFAGVYIAYFNENSKIQNHAVITAILLRP